MLERTLVIFKPDAVQRGLMGRILLRFEEKGLKVVGMKLTQLARSLLEQHYSEHRGKPFYEGLLQFMSRGPSLLLCLEGPSAIEVCRGLMGATSGLKAVAGTIRGDFSSSKGMNLIHGSDGSAAAEREVRLFFHPEELLTYERNDRTWVFSDEDVKAS